MGCTLHGPSSSPVADDSARVGRSLLHWRCTTAAGLPEIISNLHWWNPDPGPAQGCGRCHGTTLPHSWTVLGPADARNGAQPHAPPHRRQAKTFLVSDWGVSQGLAGLRNVCKGRHSVRGAVPRRRGAPQPHLLPPSGPSRSGSGRQARARSSTSALATCTSGLTSPIGSGASWGSPRSCTAHTPRS